MDSKGDLFGGYLANLEARRSQLIFIVLLLSVVILAASSLRDPFALDSYWHLKTGQDWVEKGLTPFVDHYSISYIGQEIRSQAYIFQVILYGFVEKLGLDTGFRALVFIGTLSALAFFVLWLRVIRAPIFVVCLTVPILVALLQIRTMARPEIFDYAFLIAALILYEKARKGLNWKSLSLILILLISWNNYHPIGMGYIVFSFLFLDLFILNIRNSSEPKQFGLLFIWGGLIFLAGFLHPKLVHPLIEMMSFNNEWASNISEFRNPFIGSVSPVTLGFVFLAMITLVALFRLRYVGYFLLCLIFTVAAFKMVRMVTPSGVVAITLLSFVLGNNRSAVHWNKRSPNQQRVIFLFGTLIFASTVILTVLTAQIHLKSNRYSEGRFPNLLVQHMRSKGRTGNIFNEYSMGGYLVYMVGEKSRVYIDGRTGILYPPEHVSRWKEAMISPDFLRSEIERLQIDHLVLGNQRKFTDLAMSIAHMKLDFSDLKYSLYTSDPNPAFPILGELWAKPWCWNDNFGNALNKETTHADVALPGYSPAAQLNELALKYLKTQNQKEFLYETWNSNGGQLYEDNLRFAGYRSMEVGLYDLAAKWFLSLRQKVFRDFLAGAFSTYKAGDSQTAKEILIAATRVKWGYLPREDVQLYEKLHEEIRADARNSIDVSVKEFCKEFQPTTTSIN